MLSPLRSAQPSLSRRLPESNRCSLPLGHVSASDPQPLRHGEGYVYVAEADGGRVKIGWTQDPAERVRLLESRTGSYVHLWGLIPGTLETEAQIHQRWSHLHIEREWFRADQELLTWAEGLVVA